MNAGWSPAPTSICFAVRILCGHVLRMSSVNESKYRVLSESMNAAFRPITKSFAPIQFGENARSIRQPDFSVIMDVPVPINIKPEIPGKSDVDVQVETDSDATQAAGGDGEGEFPVNATLQFLEGEVQDAFGELIEDEQIDVRQNPLWMEIEIKSTFCLPVVAPIWQLRRKKSSPVWAIS